MTNDTIDRIIIASERVTKARKKLKKLTERGNLTQIRDGVGADEFSQAKLDFVRALQILHSYNPPTV